MKPDLFLDEQLRQLERLVAGRDPTALEARRARVILLRARQARRDGILARAPRLRRHILADIRAATRSLERVNHV